MNVEIPVHTSDIVDLRSDTVTKPSAEMYKAMIEADLGDDVLGDDPTVHKLEALAAKTLGKPAAMFTPSGTMANQAAIATHVSPGDAIIAEREAHVLYYEVGAPAVLNGALTWTVKGARGVMDPQEVQESVVKRSLHSPGTVLICVENTHNRAGGTVVPVETMAAYRRIADQNEMRVHLDGARLFNAAVATGKPAESWASLADSVSICLSKGLRSPVGSVLCGSEEFIARARVWRKRLGGGMRQAGLLAACGIVSLTQMVDRLADDHRRARKIAQAVGELPGFSIDWDTVQTNMVMVNTDRPAAEVVADLAKHKVLALPPAPNRIRLVLHADVDDEKADRAVRAFAQVARQAV